MQNSKSWKVIEILSLRADEIKLWLTNQSLVIVCTQATRYLALHFPTDPCLTTTRKS